jgi:hypothetical protein
MMRCSLLSSIAAPSHRAANGLADAEIQASADTMVTPVAWSAATQ